MSERTHRPRPTGAVTDPWLIGFEIFIALLSMAGRVAVWLFHHPWFTLAAGATYVAHHHTGPYMTAGLWALVVVGLVVWRTGWHPSFDRAICWRVRGSLRAWVVYGWRWRSAMTMADLADVFDGADYVPRLRRVRSNRHIDRLTVRLLRGQHPDDYGKRADVLAHTFGKLACQVRIAGPGRIYLDFTRRDALAAIIPALPVPEAPHLEALPIGRREDGEPWTVRLRGSHILIAGTTGAGKGSVLWSIVRALGPHLRDGLVRLWVLDPKGGMELAAGQPLFHRFACETADGLAELLEAAVAEMRARAARLRGVTRLHTPSVDEPLIVVVVDELAALTAYAERAETKRMSAALSLLLSQGRAVGVVVVAALQDPRKEVLPFRDLFPTRIALALVEAAQTDMVLGPGARDRGADCSRIPLTQPGTGWVWCDGEPEPARVRAGWVTDHDIAAMGREYGRGVSGPAAEVIDLDTRQPDEGQGDGDGPGDALGRSA
jgi:S-DNA-T family DNA segregation ATPase FtsK/SpoIIIE